MVMELWSEGGEERCRMVREDGGWKGRKEKEKEKKKDGYKPGTGGGR